MAWTIGIDFCFMGWDTESGGGGKGERSRGTKREREESVFVWPLLFCFLLRGFWLFVHFFSQFTIRFRAGDGEDNSFIVSHCF